jgi:hypothetical protein
MHRTRSAWVLLLAVFLGVLPRAGRPDLLGGGATVRATAGSRSPDAYYVLRPAARMYPAHETRSPTDRQTAPLGGMLRAHATLPHLSNLTLGARPPLSVGSPAEQARHFPLFPTGPPSHK